MFAVVSHSLSLTLFPVYNHFTHYLLLLFYCILFYCILLQGIPQLISNINACQAVADTIRTTLGPAGRDKLLSGRGGSGVTISNDGATVLQLLEIAHPAAQTVVDISMSQDSAVGDGTTSVVLFAGELLGKMKPFIEEGVHPQVLAQHLRTAGAHAVAFVRDHMATTAPALDQILYHTAATALHSKLIANHTDLFAPMVVDAVTTLSGKNTTTDTDTDTDDHCLDQLMQSISIKKIPGGDVRQSCLVHGVAFPKTFSYAGFEQMTKRFEHPHILLLNIELELKAEKENAEVRIAHPSDYQRIVDAEWKIIYDKLDQCIATGANIVLSKLPIGDLATQYFADRGLFCAGRVPDGDLTRVAQACGGSIQTSTTDLMGSTMLGTCGLFEEKQIGDERFNLFTECPATKTCTILLRGGTEQFIAESERSVHDALQVVKRALLQPSIVPGGGAVEMAVARHLYDYAYTIQGKGHWIVRAFAQALEVVPRQLAANAGLDPMDTVTALRQQHAAAASSTTICTVGVNVTDGGTMDTMAAGIWEPADNKIHSFQAATEAACLILSIDETVIAPRSQDPAVAQSTGMLQGDGAPMTNMMTNAMSAAQGPARTGQLAPGVSYMKGRGGR